MVQKLRSCLDDLKNNDMLYHLSFSPYVRMLMSVITLLRKNKLTNVTKKNTKEVFKLLKDFFPTA